MNPYEPPTEPPTVPDPPKRSYEPTDFRSLPLWFRICYIGVMLFILFVLFTLAKSLFSGLDNISFLKRSLEPESEERLATAMTEPELTDLTEEQLAADPRIGMRKIVFEFLLHQQYFGAAAMMVAEFISHNSAY